MLVNCPACGQSYRISEEKVAGRELRIRCRRCENVIAVDGRAGSPLGGPPALPSLATGGPRLRVESGPDAGREFALDSASTRLGRGHACEVVLNDVTASRVHAMVQREGERFFLVDLGSGNGSFVNGVRADRVELAQGDSIQVGNSVLSFTGVRVDPEEATVVLPPAPLPPSPPPRAARPEAAGAPASPPPPPALPDFGGRYVQVVALREGRRATLYRAVESVTGRRVFIKMIAASRASDAASVTMFLNEPMMSGMLAAAGCPILPVIRSDRWQGRPFFVQELIEGWNLAAAMAPRPRFTPEAAFRVIESLCESLAAVHDQGVVHGDLSPENVFCETASPPTENGTLPADAVFRLIDFECARRIHGAENASNRSIPGKAPYLAPEVARGEPLSVQSDLFAVGVMAFELLAGERPHNLGDFASVARLTPPGLRELPAELGVPRKVAAILRSLLSVDPAERPASASAVLEELESFRDVARWLGGEGLAGRRQEPDAPGTSWSAEGEGLLDALFGADESVPPAPPASPVPVPPAPPDPIPVPAAAPKAAGPPPAPAPPRRMEVTTGFFDLAELIREAKAGGMPASPIAVAAPVAQFSVFAPDLVQPNSTFAVDVAVYLPADREAVLSGSHAPTTPEEGGTVFAALLDLPGFAVTDPVSWLSWSGRPARASFSVRAPAVVPFAPAGCVRILYNGLLVARLAFHVGVPLSPSGIAPAGRPYPQEPSPPMPERRVRTAFASYASEDRDEVLRRVQGIAATGVDVFVDVVSLRSGQRWLDTIRERVSAADQVYLFWSRAAKASRWVEEEWKCALRVGGVERIHPVPLEDPTKAPPPPELASLHFNDLYLALLPRRGPKGWLGWVTGRGN